MVESEIESSVDPVLRAFLETTDEAESQSELAKLLTGHARPVSMSILRNKLAGDRKAQDGEDLYAEVRLRLLRQLRELRERRSEGPIRDFSRYVAAVTYHAWDDYLRQRHPRRASAKNRVRYLLTHREDLALWKSERGELLCGFASWRDKAPHRPRLVEAGSLDQWVRTLLEKAGRPVELDRLVEMVVEETEEREAVHHSIDSDSLDLSDETRTPATEVEHRLFLQALWDELRSLPVRQRAAVLLNLRDSGGRSAIELFHLLGITSLRSIAEALQMPATDFARMWNDLPLEDARIGELLGVTRQQVINLRKAARERLSRWAQRAGR